jgi:hypothetical protein
MNVKKLFKIGAPQPVSILTPLLPFTDFSKYQVLILSVQNVDPTSAVTVFFETSQDGFSVDAALTYQYVIQPGEQCSLEVGPQQIRAYYSISAETSSPFPTALVTFEVTIGNEERWNFPP